MYLIITDNGEVTNMLYKYIEKKNIIIDKNIKNIESNIINKNMDCIDKIIVDISDLEENEYILKIISKIKVIYNIPIIIVAIGYNVGNKLLSDIFDLGIYDFIISKDKTSQDQEIRNALKGNNYIDALKFKIQDEKKKIKKTKTRKKVIGVGKIELTPILFKNIIFEFIECIGYIIITILISIGATAIINSNIREILIEIFKGVF